MIFGACQVTGRAVETHRDSYLLDHLTVISVRRPFMPTATLMALGGTAFTVSFADLLYAHEIGVLVGGIVGILTLGNRLGQIQLLSRDLRGSELSSMIWGTYGHLNRVRRDIGLALQDSRKG